MGKRNVSHEEILEIHNPGRGRKPFLFHFLFLFCHHFWKYITPEGDGNYKSHSLLYLLFFWKYITPEGDGNSITMKKLIEWGTILEIHNPGRGRKHHLCISLKLIAEFLEIHNPGRGRKLVNVLSLCKNVASFGNT